MIKPKTVKQKKADQEQKEKAAAKLFKRAETLRQDMWDNEFNASWVLNRTYTRLFDAVRSYEAARERAKHTHTYSEWETDRHAEKYGVSTAIETYKE